MAAANARDRPTLYERLAPFQPSVGDEAEWWLKNQRSRGIGMADQWETAKAADVRPGQRVRTQDGIELTATRIEAPFLGRDNMLAFIEDTDVRWFKRPAPVDADVEVLTAE